MSLLFEETSVNSLKLKNRFVRSATWAAMADEDGQVTPRLVILIKGLAEGGAGLIITGHAYVDQAGKHSPGQLGIHSDRLLTGLRQMTRAGHANGGRIVAQLGYGGAYLSRARVENMGPGKIEAIVNAFAGAAARAREAGFDGVQIFAAHGFLLSQFLCPRYNRRKDRYGGRIENRARILIEVLTAIRAKVGPDYPVLAKLNAVDGVVDGLTLEDSLTVGGMLAAGGIDAIELSGGLLNIATLLDRGADEEAERVAFEHEARRFKRRLDIPIILVGGIRSLEVAEKLVISGAADYISMCRPFIREPGLINRWSGGDHQPAACVSCNNCVEEAKEGRGVSCVPPAEQEIQTFFPQETRRLPAGPAFPAGTYHEVSIGLEQWSGEFLPVVKVLTRQGGKSIDRGLSIPVGGRDHSEIHQAIEDLLAEYSRKA